MGILQPAEEKYRHVQERRSALRAVSFTELKLNVTNSSGVQG